MLKYKYINYLYIFIMPKTIIVFLLIFWSIFLATGWFLLHWSLLIVTKWELTTWEIIKYNTHLSDNTTMYTPIIEYKCWGKSYIKKSNSSTSWKSYEIWEITNIYCIWNKYIFDSFFDKYFWLIFVFVWLIVLSIPSVTIIINRKKHKYREQLLRNWDYIRAKVTFVWYNNYYKVNWESPMYFECEYLDRDRKEIYKYKSDYFWHSSLNDFIKVWDERKIYVNRINMKKYYVDIEDIPKVA